MNKGRRNLIQILLLLYFISPLNAGPQEEIDKLVNNLPQAGEKEIAQSADQLINNHEQLSELVKRYSKTETIDGIIYIKPDKSKKKQSSRTIRERVRVISHCRWSEQLKLKIERMWQQLTLRFAHKKQEKLLFFDDENKQIFYRGDAKLIEAFTLFLRQIDRPKRQVKIEARIILVDQNTSGSVNLAWRRTAVQKHKGGDGVEPLLSLIGSTLSLTTVLPRIINSIPGFKMLDILLTCAEKNNKIKTLLKPTLVSIDGEKAELLEGQVIPIERVTEEHGTGKSKTLRSAEYKDVGISLRVTPRILPGTNKVSLNLIIENSFAQENSGKYPTLVTSRIKNRVVVTSGKITLLGGLIKRHEERGESGIPVLSKIPLFGRLFRGSARQLRRMQLLVLLQPTVV